MFRPVRFALPGLALLLLTACASEPAPTNPASAETSGDADTYFAMFVSDPTNRDSWQWLCRAAAGGIPAAQYNVGIRYRNGLPPVAQDPSRAYLWLTAASRNGLTAGTVAAEAVAKSLPERQLDDLRKRTAPLTQADCHVKS
jgi:TPR repeat protein